MLGTKELKGGHVFPQKGSRLSTALLTRFGESIGLDQITLSNLARYVLVPVQSSR